MYNFETFLYKEKVQPASDTCSNVEAPVVYITLIWNMVTVAHKNAFFQFSSRKINYNLQNL
jgi:hypothetical protein